MNYGAASRIEKAGAGVRGGVYSIMLSDEKKYTVYMHVAPNGKRYIGITSRKPEKRWGHGTGYKENGHFFRAIKKYTWEKIEHIVLADCLTKKEACEMEKSLIAEYRTTDPEYGYNHTDGGEHYEFNEETIKRLRGPKNLSEETREAMRKRGAEIARKYLAGRKATPEQIAKMAASKRGKKQPPEVVKKRTEAIRRQREEAGGFTAEHRRHISEALKGRTYSAETLEKMRAANAPERNGRSRHVLQIKGGAIIREYVSARAAMRETGIHFTSIVRVCNRTPRKSGTVPTEAGGYEWRYA